MKLAAAIELSAATKGSEFIQYIFFLSNILRKSLLGRFYDRMEPLLMPQSRPCFAMACSAATAWASAEVS
jgi:hypothetical protein